MGVPTDEQETIVQISRISGKATFIPLTQQCLQNYTN